MRCPASCSLSGALVATCIALLLSSPLGSAVVGDANTLGGAQSAKDHRRSIAPSAPHAWESSRDFLHADSSSRTLLHGCHGKKTCVSKLFKCPRCRFPSSHRVGHCKAFRKVFNCRRRGARVAFARAAFAFTASAATGNLNTTQIDAGRCPRLPGPGAAGHFDPENGFTGGDAEAGDATYEYDDSDYTTVLYGYGYEYDSEDAIRPPEFASVSTPEGLQAALRVGAHHILLTAHLDMTGSPTEPDIRGLEALNTAVGRVLNTTRSIAGSCISSAPEEFGLTEPVPRGACAILVREDFLDAPLGTGCLLLDSLYVAVASPAGRGSSVLILHVDGLMWITNSVFQGAGTNSRAIDTNTIDGGIPELYIQGTTFTGFARDLAPGIRVLPGGLLWLDDVTFRSISLLPIQGPPRRRRPRIQATAVVAYANSTLIFANVAFEDNYIDGEPAGDRAVAVAPSENATQAFTTPRMRVWVWPDGPFQLTFENTTVAQEAFESVARPELRNILAVQRQVRQRANSRSFGIYYDIYAGIYDDV